MTALFAQIRTKGLLEFPWERVWGLFGQIEQTKPPWRLGSTNFDLLIQGFLQHWTFLTFSLVWRRLKEAIEVSGGRSHEGRRRVGVGFLRHFFLVPR